MTTRATLRRYGGWRLLVSLCLLPAAASAGEDPFRFAGTVTGVMQNGAYHDAVDANGNAIGDTARGSLAIAMHGSADVGEEGLAFASASIAWGNGLDGVEGVSVQVNAEDLEDDVKDVNGSGRDYLLEAWYAHRFEPTPGIDLKLTGGIIDATRYIDQNRVANDEIHQFMNEVFVNRFFLPSYDPGLAVSVRAGDWSGSGVWMNSQADETNGRTRTYNFYGAEIARRIEWSPGEGNLRLIGLTTSDSFGDDDSPVHGVGFSVDQAWGERVILFARGGGFSDEDSVLVHDSLYSAGLQVSFYPDGDRPWVSGLAYAYLDGAGSAPGDVRETRVWEGYVRRPGRIGLSLDIQYVADELYGASNRSLWSTGLRANYRF